MCSSCFKTQNVPPPMHRPNSKSRSAGYTDQARPAPKPFIQEKTVESVRVNTGSIMEPIKAMPIESIDSLAADALLAKKNTLPGGTSLERAFSVDDVAEGSGNMSELKSEVVNVEEKNEEYAFVKIDTSDESGSSSKHVVESEASTAEHKSVKSGIYSGHVLDGVQSAAVEQTEEETMEETKELETQEALDTRENESEEESKVEEGMLGTDKKEVVKASENESEIEGVIEKMQSSIRAEGTSELGQEANVSVAQLKNSWEVNGGADKSSEKVRGLARRNTVVLDRQHLLPVRTQVIKYEQIEADSKINAQELVRTGTGTGTARQA